MGLNFSGMMNASMAVITKPSTASFQAAKGSVNTMSTVVGLLVAGAIAGLIGAIATGGYVSGLIGGAIGAVIGFYIAMLIIWVIAKIVGGTGGLMDQSNLLGTFSVPFLVVNAILGLIPGVGGILSLVLGVYSLYLTGLGLQVAHTLTSQKAWIVVAILVILYIVFAIFVAATIAAVLIGLGAMPK